MSEELTSPVYNRIIKSISKNQSGKIQIPSTLTLWGSVYGLQSQGLSAYRVVLEKFGG
jgi:hypothetical protein